MVILVILLFFHTRQLCVTLYGLISRPKIGPVFLNEQLFLNYFDLHYFALFNDREISAATLLTNKE